LEPLGGEGRVQGFKVSRFQGFTTKAKNLETFRNLETSYLETSRNFETMKLRTYFAS
jgi:hypothetical protein